MTVSRLLLKLVDAARVARDPLGFANIRLEFAREDML